MSIKDKLSSLVAMSEKMLELAKSGEWEKVTEIESQRSPQLEAFFNSLKPDELQNNSDLLRQVIEKILVIDNEVVALGVESKKGLVELFQKSNSSRQALSEYQKNTGL